MAVGETSLLSVLLLVLLQGTANSFKLQIHPRHAHHSLSERVRIMCTSDEPITHCEFRSFYKSHYSLNQGQRTPPRDEYRYHGNGLEDGECGIDLQAYRRQCHDIVECRVRTANHGWRYASAMIEISNEDPKPVYNVHPSHAHVTSGSNISALGRGHEEVNSCSYKWIDDSWIHFDQSTHLEIPESDRNLGSGLKNGDCAVILPNVRRSGFVIFLAFRKTLPRDTAMSHMTVLVYKAPNPPELTLVKEFYKEGEEMTATCVIKDSRPVSNITWYLGDDVIRNDTLDDATGDNSWRWSYDLQEITQRVTRKLTWEDDGKELACRAGHHALPLGRLDAKRIIRVIYAPRPVSRPMEVSSFDLHESVTIKCRYFANPQPVIDWSFVEPNVGSAVADKRYNITKVTKVGNHYESSLTIYNLTLMDDGQKVFMNVMNIQGGVTNYVILDINIPFDDLMSSEYDYDNVEDQISFPHVSTKIPTSSSEAPTTTAMTTAMTTTPIATTPVTTIPTTSVTMEATTVGVNATTVTANNTTEAENGTSAAIVDATPLPPLEESHGTSRKIGLAFGIIGLIIVVVGISFFIYKRSSRTCMTGLPYANFRRARVDDGEEESFNVNGDLDERF